ncbi:hypothetical protein FB451DRAFT_189953 [Mycena latifolia]|nr:hypothetical protein FB451DRAFT_189953 [Mycena latifolia]
METEGHTRSASDHSQKSHPITLGPGPAAKAWIRDLLRSHSQPPDHLRSTISALSKEVAQCDEDISSYADQISHFESEISRLQTQLARAKADRAELQSHYDNVRSLLSPIRRLPPEILVDIFTLFRITSDVGEEGEEETPRLTQKPLLAVSQVCARWHALVLGTPTLWDNIHLYGPPLWRNSKRAKRGIQLLRLALERSQNSPLDITIIDPLKYNPPLDLLAKHSARCKTIDFMGAFPQVDRLFRAPGKFPSLETLTVILLERKSGGIDFFDLAPRMKTFAASVALLKDMPSLPLDRLDTFGCLASTESEVTASVALMARTPHTTRFRLELFLGNWTFDNVLGFDIPHTSSDIGSLSMEVQDYFKAEHCVKALSDIFASLTLPRLQELSFRSMEHPLSLMHWPHSTFLDLAVRSSFHTNLHSLDVSHVVVTEANLVECLSALPCLHRLAIADHEIHDDSGANEHLITDSLLSKLTLAANLPPLVPRLRSLTCDSVLQFDDNVFLRFLVSRRQQAPDAAPFSCQMYWMDDHQRDFDSSVIQRLRELRINKEVACEFSCTQHWMR